MDGLNFWLMDACVTALVFCSALYGRAISSSGNGQDQAKSGGQFLMIPDSFLSPSSQDDDVDDVENGSGKKERRISNSERKDRVEYVVYGTMVVLYFAATTSAVILAKRYPLAAAGVQYACIFTFIIIGMNYILPSSKFSLLLALVMCLIWAASGATPYRWLANNGIICFSVLVAGHMRFQNFFYLQIFIWVAFVYDVIVLSGFKLRTGEWNFFSFDQGECDRLICDLFSHNYHFQMPAVFTVNIVTTQNQVFIGTGDILIGAIVANFAATFFKSVRCAFVISLVFGGAIATLSAVSLTPFPALLTIVPACTLAVLLCSFATNSLKALLVGETSVKTHNQQEHKVLVF